MKQTIDVTHFSGFFIHICLCMCIILCSIIHTRYRRGCTDVHVQIWMYYPYQIQAWMYRYPCTDMDVLPISDPGMDVQISMYRYGCITHPRSRRGYTDTQVQRWMYYPSQIQACSMAAGALPLLPLGAHLLSLSPGEHWSVLQRNTSVILRVSHKWKHSR